MDNDEDMVEKAARYIFHIIYDETSLSGLIMALSAFFSGGGAFLPYYQAGVDNWPQNRLSRVGVGISPGLLFPSHPFFFQGKAEVRHISEQMTRRTFTLTCGTWLYTRHSSLLKAFQLLSSELRPGPLIFQGFMCHK